MKQYGKCCVYCKKLFTAHRKDKVYCSQKCKFTDWKMKGFPHPWNKIQSPTKEEKEELKKLREQDNWKKLGHIVK